MRVVIGDASALSREGLAALLIRHGVQVAACSGTLPELDRVIVDVRPDLAVVDARLPGPAPDTPPDRPAPSDRPDRPAPSDRPAPAGRPGLSDRSDRSDRSAPDGRHDPPAPPDRSDPAPRSGPAGLRVRHPQVGLLVLADEPRVELARELLRVGGAGLGLLVRPRIADVSALLDAARLVAAGGSAVDPEVVARLLTPDPGPLAGLSARELDVLALLAEGRTNSAIAGRLWLTPRTVEGHVRSIFGKLRLPVTAEDHRRVLAARAYLAARAK